MPEILPENDFVLVLVGKAAAIRKQLEKYGAWTEKKSPIPAIGHGMERGLPARIHSGSAAISVDAGETRALHRGTDPGASCYQVSRPRYSSSERRLVSFIGSIKQKPMRP